MENLSKRLQAVADLVEPGRIACDAGCDHGYVSIYLVKQNICPHVYAMDVRPGPLARAKEHIVGAGLENRITAILSDGVTMLDKGAADCLILAGMGGRLMMKILIEGRDKIHEMKELILQPQSELMLFRRFLREEGYRIVREDMVLEDGKFYPILKVVTEPEISGSAKPEGTETGLPAEELQEVFDCYGQKLLEMRHPVLKQYLEKEQEMKEQIRAQILRSGGADSGVGMAGEGAKRLRELDAEAVRRRTAFSFYTLDGEGGKGDKG